MALGSAPLAATPPPSAQDDYRAAEDEKQTNNKPPQKSPNLPASLIQKKHHAGQDRTGQDSKALGGGKVSKRDREERGPDPMLYGEGSKQASQGYVMAMQGVDRDRCQWTALPKCNLPQPCLPIYFWRATSGVV